jgi:hypothetical protein
VLLWASPRGCTPSGGSGGAAGSGGTAAPGAANTARLAVTTPSVRPTQRIGVSPAAGAIVPAEAVGATVAADDLPGSGAPLASGAGNLAEVMTAAGTAAGQVVVAGSAQDAPGASAGARIGAGMGALAEGRMVGAFAAARPLGGPAAPVAASSGYLGDTVLASPVRTRSAGWAIAVRAQRHYSAAFAASRLVPVGTGPVSAVAATMDYRADILLVWTARGGVYAREIAQASRLEPTRRLGSAAADPEVRALLSDDGHAIVAWRSQTALGGAQQRTTIELSISGASLAFRGARLLERFRDPRGFALPPGSLRLIRLSSEAVMLAWTGIDSGRYVVRASPVSLHRGAWAPVVISGARAAAPFGVAAVPVGAPGSGSASDATSAPGSSGVSATPGSAPAAGSGLHREDAVLAALVPGPHAEALALWSAAPRLSSGAPNPRRRAILAARGHYAGPGEVAFEASEVVAPPGPNEPPTAAFDPQTGRALAAWVTLGVGGSRIAYALRAAGSASSPPPAQASASTGRTSPTFALSAFALLALAAAAAVLYRAPRRPALMRARRG